ncbi:reverse transcriptase, partial [Thalictrum thalictroides]
TTNLLDDSQIGGRLKKSAVDATLLLTNEIQTNKTHNLLTSTLFLDVKGAFDHVAKNQLLGILKEHGLPINLISWIAAFLSDRELRLAFDGQCETFSKIETGIPQGSPVSPILFLIYIKNLFQSRAVRFISYMDDICIIASSKSIRKNIKILEREASHIYALGTNNAIDFDLAKTELVHFSRSKDAKKGTMTLPNGDILSPNTLVRWLGIWFDPLLSFSQHIAIRTTQATKAFYRLARLANTERGLSPSALRQIYLACVTSVSDYGSVVWWKGQNTVVNHLQKLQNKALRKILGAFRTSPVLPMEAEAALAPPQVRLNVSIGQYALRLHQLSKNHPVNIELAKIELSRKPSQLERIKRSSLHVYDAQTIEKIKHFQFPPWQHPPQFQCHINHDSKEEATRAHLTEIDQLKNSNTTLIYTDASIMEESQGVGVGIHARNLSTRKNESFSVNIGPETLVFDGELEGITQGLEYIARVAKKGHSFRVYADNQASITRLNHFSDKPGQWRQLRAIKATQSIRQTGAEVTICWVPAHMNIPGNEQVDKEAKVASLLPPQVDQSSFAWIKQRLKEDRDQMWRTYLQKQEQKKYTTKSSYSQKFQWKINASLAVPRNTKRSIASAFYQLKLGHGYNRAYLHKFGHSHHRKCECGKIETPEHLLLSCKIYHNERKVLRKDLNFNILTLKSLLHTQRGIEKTVRFIEKTNIGTRKWHLERLESEQEMEGEDFEFH